MENVKEQKKNEKPIIKTEPKPIKKGQKRLND